MTPKTLASKPRRLFGQPPVQAKEEAIVDCVASFKRRGKRREKKNTIRWNREKRSLPQDPLFPFHLCRSLNALKNTKALDKIMTFTNSLIKLVLV